MGIARAGIELAGVAGDTGYTVAAAVPGRCSSQRNSACRRACYN